MQLVISLMVLVGVCCASNSYAMHNHTQQTSQNLLQANLLIKQAEVNLTGKKDEQAPFALVVYQTNFLPKNKITETVNLMNQAKSLIQPIIDDRTASFAHQQKAQDFLYIVNGIMQEINKAKK